MSYFLNKNIIISNVDESEALLFDIERKKTWWVNQTVLFVLNMLKENPLEKEEIADRLYEEFEISIDEVKKDVNCLIRELLEEGIIYEEKEEIYKTTD